MALAGFTLLFDLGCGHAALEAQDAGASPDAGAPADAGALPDAGTSPDGGAPGVTVAALEFLSADPSTLSLRGSGGVELSRILFQAKDASGRAVPAGVAISFSLASALGGASLDPTVGRTDDKGQALTTLRSGNTPGDVTVRASAGGAPADALPVLLVGVMPSYRNLAFSCEESGIAGFASSSLTMNCTVFIADRNSQRMPLQQVTFLAEAGAIDRFATTDALGSAVAVYRATAPGPMDVAAMAPGTARATSPITWTSRYAGVRPSGYDGVIAQPWYGGGVDTVQNGELNGEPSRLGVCGSGANGTCNPRDGLVSLIAIVSGEEQWDDLNRNGQWDPGEDFLDLPEPFIDVNDDGKYDMAIEGENYVDVNQNGKWDGPNGKWDAATRIWKTAKVVWTGDPSSSVFATDTRSPPLPVPSPLTVPHCSNPVGVVLVVADANLNFPANAAGDLVDCRTSSGLASAKPTGYAVHDGHHGRKDILVSVSDNHVCSPDCLRVTVPCSGGPDSLQCTGSFRSIGGFTATLGSAGPTVSLDVK